MNLNRLAATALILSLAGTGAAIADDEYDDFLKEARASYSSFAEQAKKDYEEFRRQMNEEYAKFLSEPWEEKPVIPEIKPPKEEPVPPVIIPEEERDKPIEDKPIVIDVVVVPVTPPTPQPEPVVPIPVPEPSPLVTLETVTLYGTPFELPLEDVSVNLRGVNEQNVAQCWEELAANKDVDALINALLKLRTDRSLPDWAYYQLCRETARKVTSDPNAANMLMGYLMIQSGYALRFASTGSSLHALVRCDERILRQPYFTFDDKTYYAFEPIDGRVFVCNNDFPEAKPMSLRFTDVPKLSANPSPARKVTARHYPEVSISYAPNQNLMSFYDGYPLATARQDPYNPWAKLAMTPISDEVKEVVYPALKSAIAGKSQRDAANIIIDFVESFPYAYDDEVWGEDRPFYPEETLHYPGSDCEDHAVLFVRLVNDLMHLPTALIHYPGHLAAAVAFTEEVNGSYITNGNRRFTVCDPTIFYSGVGRTMRGMNNEKATLLVMPSF